MGKLFNKPKLNFVYKNGFILFFGTVFIPIKSSLANCSFTGNSPYPNSTSVYVQNGDITCTGSTTTTASRANYTGYGGNFLAQNFISTETSQVLRWSNTIETPSKDIKINIAPEAEITGTGITKGLVLVHNGFYRTDGNGNVPALNSRYYTPNNKAKITITNNGSIKYTATTQNTDRNTASAVSIESNDGPADQFIINNGDIYSSSAYGVLMSGIAVYGSVNNFLPLNDYQYTYNNIVGITNNGNITQDIGTIANNTSYAGHSGAVTLITPSAKEVFLINNQKAKIQGMESGVDILTSDYVQSSYIKNYGQIIGDNESGISITPGAITQEMSYTPSIDIISNYKTGTIIGGKSGIGNYGKIDTIENYGKISGPNSIETSAGEITKSINNYGILEGHVLLGKATLNLERSADSVSTNPAVFGNITGTEGSTINIGGAKDFTKYVTSGNASVDSINILSNSNLQLTNNDAWEATGKGFTNSGTLSLAPEITSIEVKGSFSNAGIIDISSSPDNQTLNINGNYFGNQGSVRLNTTWNDNGSDNGLSESDQLIITGNASGKTQVFAYQAGKEGIVGDIRAGNRLSTPVINVNGEVNSSNFYGYASTLNAEEAQLIMNKSKDQDGSSTFSWVLESDQGTIISPDIPGYVNVAYANIEMLRDSIGTYHDRIGVEGNKKNISTDEKNKELWGRLWNRNMRGGGEKQFDWKSKSTGQQIGYTLRNHQNEKSSILSNIYISYVYGDSKSYDDRTAESGLVIPRKYTGEMKTNNINLGFTQTYINKSDGYKDFVLQISGIHNKYNSRRQRIASNNGWGLNASFEQGATYSLNTNFSFEPMYQIMINYLSLNDFNDGLRSISQGSQWDALFRTGGRIYYKNSSDLKENLFFVKAYYARDFVSNGSARVGLSYLTEKNSKQWAELGFGFQKNQSKNTYLFMDAGLDRNLGGAYRKSYNVNFGISHRW